MCTKCRMTFKALPTDERMFVFQCPICQGSLEASWAWEGQSVSCPHCNCTIDIPKPPLSTDSIIKTDAGKKDVPDQPLSERNDKPVYEMTGVQDLLHVFTDRVEITPKGILGFLNKGITGTKYIPFSSIVAVQFKESGAVFSGFLQFTIPGGVESRRGIFAATKDENTFMFIGAANNALARTIKHHIDQAVAKGKESQTSLSRTSLADELQKLSDLKSQGILTDQEFQAAKSKLIR